MSNRQLVLLLGTAVALAGCIKVERDEPDPVPVAVITVTPDSGPAPLTVSVSGESSTVPGSGTATYDWDFGDETSATGARAEHTYALSGGYVITLTVTDAKGRTGSTTASVNATGTLAVYDASAFDATGYREEPADSGTYDATVLQ
jgi:PKD repeat protein